MHSIRGMHLSGSVAILIALCMCPQSNAAWHKVGASLLPDGSHSKAKSQAARKLLDSHDCTVDWIGTDNESTFDSSLELLSKIPNEHDTLAGRS